MKKLNITAKLLMMIVPVEILCMVIIGVFSYMNNNLLLHHMSRQNFVFANILNNLHKYQHSKNSFLQENGINKGFFFYCFHGENFKA